MLNAIPGVSVQQAEGALYLFPKLDPEVYPIRDDEKFVLDLLQEQKILISHGRAFNWIQAGPLPPGHAAQRQGPGGSAGPDRRVSGSLPTVAALSARADAS